MIGWVWSDLVNDALAGVVEVACVMEAVGVHIVEVFAGFDVWVEILNVGEGLGPGIEGLMDDEGNAGGEVSEPSAVEVDVVYISCGNAAGCVDDGVISFGGCSVEVEDVANGGTEMGKAPICDDLALRAERGRGGGGSTSSSSTAKGSGSSWRGGVVWVCSGCVCVGIARWGGWE